MSGSRRDSERQTAERVSGELRSYRRPVDDFKGLRQEVLDLQKAERELRDEVEKLKKELEKARSPVPPAKAASAGSKTVPGKGLHPSRTSRAQRSRDENVVGIKARPPPGPPPVEGRGEGERPV